MSAFDDIASEHRLPFIDGLDCPATTERRDETMLDLARALGPALARPLAANRLFTDHVFSAMTIHLASTYGRSVDSAPGERTTSVLPNWFWSGGFRGAPFGVFNQLLPPNVIV